MAHTVRIANLTNDLSKNYQIPLYEKIILLTASLIQGVGCVKSFEMKDLISRETVEGILVGKVNLSLNILDNAVKTCIFKESKDNLTYQRLKHAVSVCDINSFQKPLTKEAILLFESFRTDYNVTASFDFISQDLNKGEFTAFDSSLKRRYYKA